MAVLEILYVTIGFIVIIAVIYYIYSLIYSSSSANGGNNNANDYPPDTYMREVGLQCPDYWSYDGVQNGRVMCRNTFNLPTNDPASCMSNGNTQTFSQINRWPVPTNELSNVLSDRCAWIQKCGEKSGQPASWIGVAEHC